MKGHCVAKVQENSACGGMKPVMCKMHLNPYLYFCNVPDCHQFLCGKIDCIDNHFHNNTLNVSKVELKQVETLLNLFASVQQQVQSSKAFLEHFQRQINNLNQKNHSIFLKRKRIQQLYEELLSKGSSPIEDRFFSSVQEIQALAQQMECQATQISQKINWRVTWSSLHSPKEIIPKLKLQFQEFRYLNFIKKDRPYQQFQQRWGEVGQSEFQYEGLVTLVFTKQSFVVGEFIANSNVQTAKLFLNSFVFIVDRNGTLRKSLVYENLLSIARRVRANQSCYQLQFSEDSEMEQMKSQARIEGFLSVERLQSFLAMGS